MSHIAWNTNRADTVTKTLTNRPKWQQDVLGKDTFYCSNDTKFKLTLNAPPNMHCIHWNGEEPNLDEDLGPIVDYNHFHTDTLLVDTAGTYIVKLTNKTFCQIYDTFVVAEVENPSKPQISILSNELASTVKAATYFWFLNDTFLFETNNPSFVPTKNGFYQVQLRSEFGCESEVSDSFLFDKLGIQELYQQFFVVYPNPSDENITVVIEKLGVYQLEVYDITGKLILTKIQNSKQATFKLKQSGNYMLRISGDFGVAERKLQVL